jgi:hypothetical protein
MDTTERIRELLLRARDLEQETEGCRAEARLRHRWDAMREATGIEHRFHALRRTAARAMVRALLQSGRPDLASRRNAPRH